MEPRISNRNWKKLRRLSSENRAHDRRRHIRTFKVFTDTSVCLCLCLLPSHCTPRPENVCNSDLSASSKSVLFRLKYSYLLLIYFAIAARVSYDIEHLMYYSKSPHAWALPIEWLKMLETVPSILRNKVIPPVEMHSNASTAPGAGRDIIFAHNSSLTTTSITTTTTTTTTSTASNGVAAVNQYPINECDPINNMPNASNHNYVINKQHISYERDSNRKPSSESDRKLYNKQLQIITNTMGAAATAGKRQQQQQQQQQSQLRAIFQRYSENDEFSLAMCDVYSGEELNNNRALI